MTLSKKMGARSCDSREMFTFQQAGSTERKTERVQRPEGSQKAWVPVTYCPPLKVPEHSNAMASARNRDWIYDSKENSLEKYSKLWCDIDQSGKKFMIIPVSIYVYTTPGLAPELAPSPNPSLCYRYLLMPYANPIWEFPMDTKPM